MYFGYQQQSFISMNKSSSQTMPQPSLLLENKVTTLQKETEKYIRKVEVEKKHYLSVEETYALVSKEYNELKKKMVDVQKFQSSTEQKMTLNKIKNLQSQLEQATAKLDEAQSENKKLKEFIESLRKERVSFLKIQENLKDEIKQTEENTHSLIQQQKEIQQKSEKTKELILKLRNKNESDKSVFMSQFDELQQQMLIEKRQRDANKIQQRKEKNEIVDISSLLKMRLKRIIASNKEKVRIIDQYLKNMKIIDEAFTQIKDASGITDIEEIMNTFIKSEEQNYSLYNYVDILTQEIDKQTEMNSMLKLQIEQQKFYNEQKNKERMATPPIEKQKRKRMAIINEKQKSIDEIRQIIEQIAPDLQQTLIKLGQSKLAPNENSQYDYELAFNLNENSIENYLQDLDYYINLIVAKQSQNDNDSSILQNTLLLDQIPIKEFKSGKPQIMNMGDDNVHGDATKLLDYKKLKEIALESLEKRKKHN